MQIRHILFPIDFSGQSTEMNSDVEWLAARFQSTVTLLHVVEVPAGWYGMGEMPLMTGPDFLAFAGQEAKRLEDYPIHLPEGRIRRATAEGSAALHIAELAHAEGADLIVMGTHGYGPLRQLLLGSTTMKVLHDAACPIWTRGTNTRESTGINKILCAVDLSGETVSLLHFARHFALSTCADVEIVHCVPGAVSRPSKYFDLEFHERLKALAREQIAQAQAEAGTAFAVHLTEGTIGQDAARLATDGKMDLIIVGRGKAHRTFGTLQTHACEIIRNAPCPVLSF